LIGEPTAPILHTAGTPPAPTETENMAWKTPKIVEVSLAMEINSYACAEIV
jgi:coenzyme PQQ precursor peptide PqqA